MLTKNIRKTVKSIAAGLIMGFAAVGMTATSALSVVITVPTGLSPDDQYRLAFVTTAVRDAISADIADYNAFVQGVAVTAGLGALGGWTAIASTATVDARDNTSTNPDPAGDTGVPIYLLNDTKLVDHYDDLWDGTLDLALGITESGAAPGPANVYTGTDPFGFATLGGGPVGSPLPFSNIMTGDSGLVTTGWVTAGTATPSIQLHFYALSAVLSVPATSEIPEPGSLSLLALGLVALAVTRRRQAGQDPSTDHCDRT